MRVLLSPDHRSAHRQESSRFCPLDGLEPCLSRGMLGLLVLMSLPGGPCHLVWSVS